MQKNPLLIASVPSQFSLPFSPTIPLPCWRLESKLQGWHGEQVLKSDIQEGLRTESKGKGGELKSRTEGGGGGGGRTVEE